MQIEKELVERHFNFVRTWDVTKELPEGSVDEYEFRCENFRCRLMYYKARSWEEPHWKLEASNLKYPFREVKIDWLENLEDLITCLLIFTSNERVFELYNNLMEELHNE